MNDIQSDFSMRKDALARDVDTLMADVQALLHDVKAETGVGTSLERHALKARPRALQERIVTLREESRAKEIRADFDATTCLTPKPRRNVT